MSNRKRASSKRARGPKLAARAHRTKQAIVKSPKQKLLPSGGHNVVSVRAASTELAVAGPDSPPNLHDASKQEIPHVENRADGLQDDVSHVMTNTDSKKAFVSATPSVQAYQAMFLEMAQANMQFPFEFAQRLASIRSPFEFLTIIAEFTSKRLDVLRKFSKETG